MKLLVNGTEHEVDAPEDMPLLWALRDLIGLTGTKYGCGLAQCGACTVLVDGQAVRSCRLPVSAAAGKPVTTIEGLSDKQDHPLQRAWIEHQVPQCGFCQSGMLMAAYGRLKAGESKSSTASGLSNICQCGTFQRVKEAILSLPGVA